MTRKKKIRGGSKIRHETYRMSGTKYKLHNISSKLFVYEVKIETNRAIITPYYLNIKINTFIMTRELLF